MPDRGVNALGLVEALGEFGEFVETWSRWCMELVSLWLRQLSGLGHRLLGLRLQGSVFRIW